MAKQETNTEMSVTEAKEIVVAEVRRRQKRNASMKQWREKNKDQYAQYMKDWYAARRLKIAAALAILKENEGK